jgi:putative flippase GtrA
MAKKTKIKIEAAAHKQKRRKFELVRIVEYMVSGGAYFWSGYLAFLFIDKGLGLTFFWAKSLSTLVGWTVNYLLQRYWVFRNPKLAKHQPEVTGRFIIITLVDFVLDYLIVYALKIHGVTPYIGQFASAGFFTVWNYFWYKAWVFSTHVHHQLHHGIRQQRKGRAK